MPIDFDAEFEQFVRKRQRLIDQLRRGGVEMDQWIEDHRSTGVKDMNSLATFAGILEVRRTQLKDLATLDDEFLERLIEMQRSGLAIQ